MLVGMLSVLQSAEAQQFDPATKRTILLTLGGLLFGIVLLTYLTSLATRWDQHRTKVIRNREWMVTRLVAEQGGKSPFHLLLVIILTALMIWLI